MGQTITVYWCEKEEVWVFPDKCEKCMIKNVCDRKFSHSINISSTQVKSE